MVKLDGPTYKVLESNEFTGLTVGSRVLKPGQTFRESQWPYGKESLNDAVKNKRCKVVASKKEKSSNKEDDKLVSKLEKMQAAYDKMDKNSDKAKSL